MTALTCETLTNWCHPPLAGCFYITGPTASGKTPLALKVAELVDAEIISMDSMAIYQGMDIGTAKPSAEDRAKIPHHMLDIVPPTESFSVSCYVRWSHRVADEIRARGKRVLVVGGTPLYLKSLLRGMFQGPDADWGFRQAVEDDVRQFGSAALRLRLEQVDPLSAFRLHPNDIRRMTRALEVARATGQPLSHWQSQFDTPAPLDRCRVAVLQLPRQRLHERVNCRVQKMIERGLLGEVQGLVARFGGLGQTASQGVGYKEMLAFLAGQADWETTVDKIKAHTRQFARRQEIWFRGLQELRPFPIEADDNCEKTAALVAEWFSLGL